MGMVEAVKTVYGKYVTFSGRARRPEFWWFVLFHFLAGGVCQVVDQTLFGLTAHELPNGTVVHAPMTPVTGAFVLISFLPYLAVAFRRIHDTGRSGWALFLPVWAFLAGAVVVGLVFVLFVDHVTGVTQALFAIPALASAIAYILTLVRLASRGQPGENRFGPEPSAA